LRFIFCRQAAKGAKTLGLMRRNNMGSLRSMAETRRLTKQKSSGGLVGLAAWRQKK
jgi:hypothetical protein